MASGALVIWRSYAKARWTAHQRSCSACGIYRQAWGMCPEGREALANHEAAQSANE